jgi:hypothetical protein
MRRLSGKRKSRAREREGGKLRIGYGGGQMATGSMLDITTH